MSSAREQCRELLAGDGVSANSRAIALAMLDVADAMREGKRPHPRLVQRVEDVFVEKGMRARDPGVGEDELLRRSQLTQRELWEVLDDLPVRGGHGHWSWEGEEELPGEAEEREEAREWEAGREERMRRLEEAAKKPKAKPKAKK